MKKKITALCLCVALLAVAVVGASLAYFTDTKSATNTFTVGNVKIDLIESRFHRTGSDNSGDSADYGNDSTVPSTIDGFVKESYDSYDYSAFEGYYLPDSGTDFDYLIIDTNGSRWRIGSNDDLAASGYLQYDADYDCIYAYNEHDGVAYQFSADGSSVNIYSLGSFTYEMSLDEFDAQAEDYNSSDSSVDLSYLAGIWYLDGDLDADSYIYIDSSGGLWGLYERAPGAETTEVDGGFISAPTDVDDVYYAVSTTYQDVTYEFTLFDTDSIVWGGENDYYERLE